LKEPEAFPGWFRQYTRVLRRATVPWISLEAVSERLLTENNPEEVAGQEEVQATVRKAVASLPKPERLVTVLFYGCHYSYTEVSAYLKIPLSIDKKRLYSARQKLRVQLQVGSREAGERARRASDTVEGTGIVLASWWRW
jgi:RNA polymerase sigma factor (sigma-70 family)